MSVSSVRFTPETPGAKSHSGTPTEPPTAPALPSRRARWWGSSAKMERGILRCYATWRVSCIPITKRRQCAARWATARRRSSSPTRSPSHNEVGGNQQPSDFEAGSLLGQRARLDALRQAQKREDLLHRALRVFTSAGIVDLRLQ